MDVFHIFVHAGHCSFPPIHGLILGPFTYDGCALSHLRRRLMIRTTALTLICLAGLGAIAAGAAIRSTPSLLPPAPVTPAVAGNKADRLPLVVNEDVPKVLEKLDTAYVQPADEVRSNPSLSTPSVATPPAPDLKPMKVDAPRTAKATKPHRSRHSASRYSRVAAADRFPHDVSAPPAKPDSAPPASQVSEVKECSSTGLSPFLRKLNLAPSCN
jgi:hypothetical protein